MIPSSSSMSSIRLEGVRFKASPLFIFIIIILINSQQTSATTEIDCSNSSSTLRKLPEAIVIGVKKSGTYALLRYLSLNPQIKAALKSTPGCDLNEIHYFDQEKNYLLGLDWYRSKMPLIECNKNESKHYLVVEKTPGYFRSAKAAERIQKFNASIKLILIVRDPVKRVQSDLTHCDVRQKELKLNRTCVRMNEAFEEILRLQPMWNKNTTTAMEMNNSQFNEQLSRIEFIRNSVYHVHMREWLKHFKMSQIYVINGDDFIERPWIELNRLETFLNVQPFIRRQHFYFDKKKNFYCTRSQYYHRSNHTNTNNHSGGNSGINGCLGHNKGRKNQVYLSQFVKNGLREYFRENNRKFFELIGKSFNW